MTESTSSSEPDALLTALQKLLRPLVRLLLRNGISLSDFTEIAREVYVKVAHDEFRMPGRKQSLSHVAVLTGVHRREVKKILNQAPLDESYPFKHNRAARVINAWRTDPQYSRFNKPLPLDVKTDFATLVSLHGGDVTPRTILQELERVGAVYQKNNTVSLMVDAYTPTSGSRELLEVFGDSAADLLATMEHNLVCPTDQRRLQLSVVHNNLPDDVLDDIEVVSQDRALVFLNALNEFMATQDRDSNPNIKGTGRNRAGVGVYFFKHPVSDNDGEAGE
ncbi:MAG: DUF6502 family protein [Pseudomonadota bacterium]